MIGIKNRIAMGIRIKVNEIRLTEAVFDEVVEGVTIAVVGELVVSSR